MPNLAAERLEIICQEGDRLIIDTAAWYPAYVHGCLAGTGKSLFHHVPTLLRSCPDDICTFLLPVANPRYHSTSILPETAFTCSIAQDLANGPPAASLGFESVQLRVPHELCRLCMTPTSTPAGAPAGTCGCDCCSQARMKALLWRCFRQSSLLTSQFIKTVLAVKPVPRQRRSYQLLALCDFPQTGEKGGAVCQNKIVC